MNLGYLFVPESQKMLKTKLLELEYIKGGSDHAEDS